MPKRGSGGRELGGHMTPNYNRYRQRLRVLEDEIRNEQFYYLDGVQVEPEDLIQPEESEEDEDAS